MTKLWCGFLYVFLVAATSFCAEEWSRSTEITLNYINNVRNKLNLTKNADINLMIGTTGVGKTALVHCIATDCSQLRSICSDLECVIEDNLDPEKDTVALPTLSRTFIPEMVVDDTGIVWYDCPGFGDTRNTTVEIATTLLIKSVIESASNVKLVLVVDYDSVTESHNRDGFDRLLSRTTQLVKNMRRFENSVSLVVSKAPAFLRNREISEKIVKRSTLQFMNKHRLSLEGKESNEQKIMLIDALMNQSSNDDYPKISIFWRPNDDGPLNSIPKMATARQNIRESIVNHSLYTTIEKNDFGFPLTAEAKIQIAKMSDETIENISLTLQIVSNQLQDKLHLKINQTDDFVGKWNLIELGRECIQKNNNSNLITLKELTERLKRIVQITKVDSFDMSAFNRIDAQENILNWLYSLVNETTFGARDLDQILIKLKTFFDELEFQVQTEGSIRALQEIKIVLVELQNVNIQLREKLRAKIDQTNNFVEKMELIEVAKHSFERNSSSGSVSLKELIERSRNIVEKVELSTFDMKRFDQIETHENNLNAIQSVITLDGISINDDLSSFLNGANTFLNELQVQVQTDAEREVQRINVSLRDLIERIDEYLPKAIENQVHQSNGVENRLEKIKNARESVQLNGNSENYTLTYLARKMKMLVESINLPIAESDNFDRIIAYENQLIALKNITNMNTMSLIIKLTLLTRKLDILLKKLEHEREYGTLEIIFGRGTAVTDLQRNNCDNCFLCYNPCDSYMRVKINGVGKYRTNTAWDYDTPIFGETFVSERITKDSTITIEMWDDDAGDTFDDLMSRWEDLTIDWLTRTGRTLKDVRNNIQIYSIWKSEFRAI